MNHVAFIDVQGDAFLSGRLIQPAFGRYIRRP